LTNAWKSTIINPYKPYNTLIRGNRPIGLGRGPAAIYIFLRLIRPFRGLAIKTVYYKKSPYRKKANLPLQGGMS
jgi:hypothetical protein